MQPRNFAFCLLTAAAFLQAGPVRAQDKTQPWTIDVGKIQAPATAWPDDKFQVIVPVRGLKNEECDVILEVTRITDRGGKPVVGKTTEFTQRGKFAGKAQSFAATFDIDVQAIQQVKADKDKLNLLEGTWEFEARVPRHPGETFAKPFHETAAVKVLVRPKKLRVLLFIDGPNREYQFVRSLFARHPDKVEFFVHAKNPGFNPDVEQAHGLKEFPNLLGPDAKDGKGMSLSGYDLVIAFDPDWKSLKAEQIRMLERWVAREGGGFVFVAGPVNTYQLSKNDADLQPLQSMLPVQFKDSRQAPVEKSTRPYVLNFPPQANEAGFLQLDGGGKGPLAGWDRYFWGEAQKPAKKDEEPVRGMYSAYPVFDVSPLATTLATFAGPKETRINDGKDQRPYLVSMPYGTGNTLYVGSGETWRLRQFKEAYHDRFWIKLARQMMGDEAKRGHSPQKIVQVLIVDGDPIRAKGTDRADSFYVKTAIDSIPGGPYEVVLAHDLAGRVAAKALERDDLAKFGAILLLNVRDLKDKQLANLEKYVAEGGGVAFFLGPKVSSTYYNESLYKEGKGLFPVPLEPTFYPPKNEPMLRRDASGGDMVLLRFDLFPDVDRYPILGPIFREKESRSVLKDLPIKRYFKVPRDQWHPDPKHVFELATLPNNQPVTAFEKSVLEIFFSQRLKAILADPANKKYVAALERHRTGIVVHVAQKSVKKNHHLAQALENLLQDRGRAKNEDYPNLTEFWASKDAKIQKLRSDVAGLLHKALLTGDPLVVAAAYGKGRVLAVMTSAGPEWTDWPAFGRCLGSFVYQPFIWESVNYLSGQK